MKELILKKCLKCGAVIKVVKDCQCDDCGIICCHEPMKEIKANSADAVVEKHKPTYTTNKDKLIVTVNHVMEANHYIEWICLLTDNKEEYFYLKPGDNPVVEFPLASEGKIYSYCNKHSLWVTDITK